MPHIPAASPLDHIRVLDLTRVRSGPTCVRQLADWGADAIKIEAPESIEPDGALGAGRATGDFQNLHRNKRSITLNLKEEKGREIFLKLVETADVVVENFRPDVKTRLGIDYQSLRARNPKIILASISGFGQTGPNKGRPGFDQIAQGMGGLQSITGEPERGPMRVGIPIADLTAGLFAAMGILTALIERDKSGEGQWLHTSLLQSQMFMLDFQAARWLMEGQVAGQAGNDHPTSIPTGLFNTSDGAMNIAVSGSAIWERFARAMGKAEWIDDDRFKTAEGRLSNKPELNAAIQDVIAGNTTEHWVSTLLEAGVPCGPVYSIDEAFNDPQAKHLGVAAAVETHPFGATECCAQPARLERTPSTIARPTPHRGEHTGELLEEIGIASSDLDDLRTQKVI